MATLFLASAQSRVAGPNVVGFDKGAHFFVYGLLGTLLVRTRALGRLGTCGGWLAVVLASLYGISDEIHQSFTPGRSVEWLDWLCDTSGAAVAVYVYSRWGAYQRWLESPMVNRSRVASPAEVRSAPFP